MDDPILFYLAALGSFMIFAGGLFLLIYFWHGLMRPVRRFLGLHAWHYRNPHDRTCEGCGRHQVEHTRHYTDRRGWWETFREGNGNFLICTTHTKRTEVDA